MDKELKRELRISAIFVIIITIVVLWLFTGFLGAPKYMYFSYYNSDTSSKTEGYVKPDDVRKISISNGFYELQNAGNAMKYCKNLTELSIYCSEIPLKNLNFIKSNDNIKKINIDGTCKDYSKLSELKNLEDIFVSDSDFVDIQALSECSNIKNINIYCSRNICLTDLSSFKNLEYLYITVRSEDKRKASIDLSNVSEAENLTNLWIFNVDDIRYPENILFLEKLSNVWFSGLNFEKEFLDVLVKLEKIEELHISDCTFNCDEEYLYSVLRDLEDKGWKVTVTDNKVNIRNYCEDQED